MVLVFLLLSLTYIPPFLNVYIIDFEQVNGSWVVTSNMRNQISIVKNFSIRSLLQKLTAQKMKFSIKDFFNKCAHLLKKSLMEKFIFCAVTSKTSRDDISPFSILCNALVLNINKVINKH